MSGFLWDKNQQQNINRGNLMLNTELITPQLNKRAESMRVPIEIRKTIQKCNTQVE